MQWVCHNGTFKPVSQPLFTATNRSFKWGDALFETGTFSDGRLLLALFHFERLFSGLQLLQMVPSFTAEQLTEAIVALCKKNNCSALARVRIAVYREDDNSASYVVEAMAIDAAKRQWNDVGWEVVFYPFARKSCDVFANLKSANYLPYLMAARYAAEKGVDEGLILNMHNRICEGSRTNLFLLTGTDIYTPALSEGCVAGVMRRQVIDILKSLGYAVHQKAITESELLEAEGMFLTNAVEGLRWVRRFGEKTYGHGVLKKIYHQLVASIA